MAKTEDIVERYGDYVVSFSFYESSAVFTLKEIYESFKERLRKEQEEREAP